MYFNFSKVTWSWVRRISAAQLRNLTQCEHKRQKGAIIKCLSSYHDIIIYLRDIALWYFLSGFFLSSLLEWLPRTITSLSEAEFEPSLSFWVNLELSSESCFTSDRFSLPLRKSPEEFFSSLTRPLTPPLLSLLKGESSSLLFESLITFASVVLLLRLREKRFCELGTLRLFTVFCVSDPVSWCDNSGVTAIPLFSKFDVLEAFPLAKTVDFIELPLTPSPACSCTCSSRPSELGENLCRFRELKRFDKPPNLRPGRVRSTWLFYNTHIQCFVRTLPAGNRSRN